MKKQISCKAILFDMDGTLLDSNEVSEISWQAWAKAKNITIEAIRAVHHGRKPEETIALVAPHLNADKEAQFIYQDNLRQQEGIYPIAGVDAFYKSLPNGSYGIVTAANRPILEHRLRVTQLPLPEVCITGNLLKRGKPDPEGYLLGAKLLGVDPKDCVVFEDAPAGLLAARRAGMRSIALLTTYTAAQLMSELRDHYEPLLAIADYSRLQLAVKSRGKDQELVINYDEALS